MSLNLRKNPMRMLHTMLRVGDLQRSIDFYTRVLGMQLLRTTDRPYKSLSSIARAITGTNRNGWAFFGLGSARSAA